MADVGQSNWEEVNLVTAGANYGWFYAEGPCLGIGVTSCATPSSYTNPIYAYLHSTRRLLDHGCHGLYRSGIGGRTPTHSPHRGSQPETDPTADLHCRLLIVRQPDDV